ncbi:antiterminator LoaP [Paenibacillus polymyxa]
MGWYVLFVETGSEDIVQKYLESQFCQKDLYSIVPKRLVPEKRNGEFYSVVKTLFPGYLLIYTKMTPSLYYELKKIPRSYRMLRNSSFELDKIYGRSQRHTDFPLGEEGSIDAYYDNFFSEIDEVEIRQILNLINDECIIEYSNVIVENSIIRVRSGPLYGMESNICKIDKRKRRAKIALDFFGGERQLELGIEVLSIGNQEMMVVHENSNGC